MQLRWLLLTSLLMTISGCAIRGEPEVVSHGTVHTGLESKVDNVTFYASRPTKSYAGIDGQLTLDNDVEVALALEGTLNRSNTVLGKNDVPFDRSATLSLSRNKTLVRIGRSKMMRNKYSLTSSLGSQLSSLWEDYPAAPMELRPGLSETLTNSIYWQNSDFNDFPLRGQFGQFENGQYGALELGWNHNQFSNALLVEDATLETVDNARLQSLSLTSVIEDDFGWNALNLWGASADGYLQGLRLTRGLNYGPATLQLSYSKAQQSTSDLSYRLFEEEYHVGNDSSLWTLEGQVDLNSEHSINLLLQSGSGVFSETPLEGLGVIAETYTDAPQVWMIGIGYEYTLDDDSIWSLSTSHLRSEASNTMPYNEWGTQTLWEFSLGDTLTSYVGGGLGQGGFIGDETGYAEFFIGLGSRF